MRILICDPDKAIVEGPKNMYIYACACVHMYTCTHIHMCWEAAGECWEAAGECWEAAGECWGVLGGCWGVLRGCRGVHITHKPAMAHKG